MKRRRMPEELAVALGVLVSCVLLYSGVWLSSALIDRASIWPEGQRLVLVVPVFGVLGVVVGALGAAISRTFIAAKITLGLLLLAAIYSFAAGWGHTGWLTSLTTFAVLAGGIYLGGVVVACRCT